MRPTRVMPRRSIRAAPSSKERAPARIGRVCAVGREGCSERVAPRKSPKRRRRTTVRPTRRAARSRRVTRSTIATRSASISAGDRRHRPNACWEPIERRRGRDSTGRGSRLWASAWRWRPRRPAEHARPAPPGAPASSPTVATPERVQLRRRSPARPPRSARPGAGGGRRARRPAGRRGARRAWRRRWRPWRGTSSCDADGDRQADVLAHIPAETDGDLAAACRRSRSIPRTSRKASSIESPSTTGDVLLEDREERRLASA